jgi:predicted HTH transcriptional regulator
LEKILLLKETLNIDQSEFIDLDDSFNERQKSILNLIIEKGSITRSECQKLLGLRQQYAQNDLSFLFRLGVLDRKIGARRKATYFLSKNSVD